MVLICRWYGRSAKQDWFQYATVRELEMESDAGAATSTGRVVSTGNADADGGTNPTNCSTA